MSEKRQPWMKWYPADWRQEPTLKLCSRGARSLWCDMLGLMHEADPYGCLLVSGKAINERQIAAVLGDSEKDVRVWLAELEEAGVFSRNDDGLIYSRRMVRDKAREDENRRNGKTGGNPRLKGEVKAPLNNIDKGEVKAGVKGGVKAHIPEARSQIPEAREGEGGADAPARPSPPAAQPKPVEPDLDLTPPVALDRNLDEAVRRWNAMAESCGLARVALLSEPRRVGLRRRLAECGGLSGWDAALERVAGSEFLKGDNDRGWKIDFDTLIKPAKFIKLMEGGYDRREGPAKKASGHDAFTAAADDVLAAIRERGAA